MGKFDLRYFNGNYLVDISRANTLFESRKFISLRFNEEFNPDFPDSIDLKITNKCSWNCPFCHESSNSEGESFSLSRTIKILDKLPSLPIEIAIGGGNIFECFSEFKELVDYIINRGMCPRVTINSKDLLDKEKLKKLEDIIPKIILGVSVNNINELKKINEIISCNLLSIRNIVYHVIVGIFNYYDFLSAVKKIPHCRFLILGYKQFGRAINTEIKDLENWREMISKLFFSIRSSDRKILLGFDNLAVDQLDLRNRLLKSEWDTYFLGQDFSHTMYVDAVDETFAPTSRSPIEERVKWGECNNNILEFFNKYKRSWN